MTTRIRYGKPVDGVSVSVKTFQHPTNGARYKIFLNDLERLFWITEELSGLKVADGRAVNMHQVKIKAKLSLEKLGITFSKEEEREVKSRQTTSEQVSA